MCFKKERDEKGTLCEREGLWNPINRTVEDKENPLELASQRNILFDADPDRQRTDKRSACLDRIRLPIYGPVGRLFSSIAISHHRLIEQED